MKYVLSSLSIQHRQIDEAFINSAHKNKRALHQDVLHLGVGLLLFEIHAYQIFRFRTIDNAMKPTVKPTVSLFIAPSIVRPLFLPK